MAQMKVLFQDDSAVKTCVVDMDGNSGVDVIRDHFLQSMSLNTPLKISYRRDVEKQSWAEIEGNPTMVQCLPGASLQSKKMDVQGVYFKVEKLNHNILQCKCHACEYAYKHRNEVDFNSKCIDVINSVWPPFFITGCVMLIGLVVVAANWVMIKDPPFCDGEEGSSCWSQWTFFGTEIGLGVSALCVLICCAILKR